MPNGTVTTSRPPGASCPAAMSISQPGSSRCSRISPRTTVSKAAVRRESRRVAMDEPDPIPHLRGLGGEVGLGFGDDLGVEIDSGDLMARPGQEEADDPLAAADVENAPAADLAAHPVDPPVGPLHEALAHLAEIGLGDPVMRRGRPSAQPHLPVRLPCRVHARRSAPHTSIGPALRSASEPRKAACPTSSTCRSARASALVHVHLPGARQARRQRPHMRLDHQHRPGVAVAEVAGDVERRALAQIVDVGLEGEAPAGDRHVRGVASGVAGRGSRPPPGRCGRAPRPAWRRWSRARCGSAAPPPGCG